MVLHMEEAVMSNKYSVPKMGTRHGGTRLHKVSGDACEFIKLRDHVYFTMFCADCNTIQKIHYKTTVCKFCGGRKLTKCK